MTEFINSYAAYISGSCLIVWGILFRIKRYRRASYYPLALAVVCAVAVGVTSYIKNVNHPSPKQLVSQKATGSHVPANATKDTIEVEPKRVPQRNGVPHKTPDLSAGQGSIVTENQHGNNTINNVMINSSDRILPPNAINTLKQELTHYSGRRVIIRIQNSDLQGNETAKFAQSLRDLFQSSGWNATLTNSENTIANGVVTTGIVVNAIGQPNVPIADFVCKQLSSLGYTANQRSFASADQKVDLVIEVWTK